jgi:hypothetical protein
VPDEHLLVVVVVVGGRHSLPAGDGQAGQAIRRALLTARLLSLRAAVVAGPVEFASSRRTDVPGTPAGLVPQVVLQVVPDRPHPEPNENLPVRPEVAWLATRGQDQGLKSP